jgi:2,4-dienoyl-CoA reductase-like NADH-dependent reductase (Old Yellow Enzyme family)
MKVFEPLKSGSFEIPNRLAVPAMVTRLSGDDGLVNPGVVERYRRFAEGGAGLIVVEASSVHGGKSGPLLKISDDGFIPGMGEIVKACQEAGPGKVFLQIIHFLKVARSGWRQTIADLSTDELEALPDLFADAASRAGEAGFDGVELHMAHAYTLSSMLSRMNKRRDRYGRTLENRLRLPSMVLQRVKDRVGDYPIGVRFLADESIRRGYSAPDASQFAVRFAELGAAYISLSVGGKFEDAMHREGSPLYPYTGYSGDRCMPGDSYPDATNMWLVRLIRDALRSAGHQTPVLGAGKIGTVELAEQLLNEGALDIVGMARGLLADPYTPMKVRSDREAEVVHCIYCNVCKSLDENFKTVVCYLWPKGATQAPRPDDHATATKFEWEDAAPLSATVGPGEVRLKWVAPLGEPSGYEILRSVDGSGYDVLTSCTRTRALDGSALRGRNLRYRVVPYDAQGFRGEPSNVVEVQLDEAAF